MKCGPLFPSSRPSKTWTMGFIKIAVVLCVIQFPADSFQSASVNVYQFHVKALSKKLENSQPKSITQAMLGDIFKENSDVPFEGELRQTVGFASNLGGIQNSTQNIISDLQESVNKALEDIEQALDQAGDNWNSTVQGILAGVKILNAANDDCILSGTPLDNVTIGFRSDVFECLKEATDQVISLGHRIDDMEWKSQKLVQDTLYAINSCGESNVLSNALCLVQNLPTLGFRTISLFIEALTTEIEFILLIPTLNFKTIDCVAEAFVSRSEEVGAIDTASIQCFVNHTKAVELPQLPKN